MTLALAVPVDLNLLVEHDISELGSDGVTRTLHFRERVYRRENLVWIERVIPAGARADEPRSTEKAGHKHLDLTTTALWLSREDGRTLMVRLVDGHEKTVINVPAAEYGNIGFDGNWNNAWHLLDPVQLKAMKPLQRAAPKGMRWYELAAGARWVRVLWDEQASIPRKVLSEERLGSSRKRMSATNMPTPRVLPWAQLESYERKEYSDYLD